MIVLPQMRVCAVREGRATISCCCGCGTRAWIYDGSWRPGQVVTVLELVAAGVTVIGDPKDPNGG